MADNPSFQRFKVLHIITRMDMGGSAQNTLDTCLHMNGRRYRSTLLYGPSLESGMTAAERNTVDRRLTRAKESGTRLVPVNDLVRAVRPVKDFLAFISILGWVHKIKPAIVHTHTSKAGLIGRLAAKLCRVPHLVHTPHGHVFYGHFGPVQSRIFLWIERLAAKITDKTIALTNREKQDYIAYRVVPGAKLATIHSGVDIRPYVTPGAGKSALKKRFGIDPAHTVVGTVGWLLPIKGPEVLLKSLGHIDARRKDVTLVYVGKGALEASLKSTSRQLGIEDRVKFLGWRDDIPFILQMFDIFALASLNEGMGRVLVEAMAAGLPVVASDTGGIPDLVSHNVNGLLFAPGNDVALADCLARLLENPREALEMGRLGRERCRAYSLEAMVDKIHALYAELLQPAELHKFN